MKNIDRVRAMTAEELAILCNDSCQMCVYQDLDKGCGKKPCVEGIAEWLRQETLKEKIDYCTMNKMGHLSNIYSDTYQEAVAFAKFDQPAYAPYQIIKRTQKFEIVGEAKVNKKEG